MFGFAMVLFGLFTAINLSTFSQTINATIGKQVSADLFVLSTGLFHGMWDVLL